MSAEHWRKIAYFAIATAALAIIYQVFFRYSYTFVDDPPLFGGVLRIDHLSGNACISWGIAQAEYRCTGR